MTPISLGIIVVATPGTPVAIDTNFAAVVGWDPGPQVTIVAASNDKLKITVDGGSAQTVTLAAGIWNLYEIADHINGQTTGMLASKTARDQLYIASLSRTASSSLVLGSIANSAYATLGLAIGSYISLPDEICCELVLRPLPGNVGSVYVGVRPTFSKSTGLDLIDVLIKDSADNVDRFRVKAPAYLDVVHTIHYFVDADNANDGVIGSVYIV
jgi:hypothetical protein